MKEIEVVKTTKKKDGSESTVKGVAQLFESLKEAVGKLGEAVCLGRINEVIINETKKALSGQKEKSFAKLYAGASPEIRSKIDAVLKAQGLLKD